MRSKFFSVLLMNWTFSDQLNFDKAKNGYRKSRMCSWFLFLLRFLNTESENVDRRSAFLRTYFSSTGQDLFFVLSSLRYVFSPRNPGVKLFAPFPQYIWSVNSFLIPWNKDNNKLRGIKAASARFLDFRERTYPLFKNKMSLFPNPFMLYKKEDTKWMGETSRTLIKPLNSKLTSYLWYSYTSTSLQ